MGSLARLKYVKSPALLKLDGTDFDNELKLLLQDATARACSREFCNRALERATYTDELYTGDGSRELWLNEYPVISVSAAKVFDGDAYTAVDATHYSIQQQRFLLYPGRGQEGVADYSYWPEDCDGNNVKVSYVAGYDTSLWATAAVADAFGVPADLERAIAEWAAIEWLKGRGGQARLGLASMSKQSDSLVIEKFEKGVPDSILKVLNAYRRVTL